MNNPVPSRSRIAPIAIFALIGLALLPIVRAGFAQDGAGPGRLDSSQPTGIALSELAAATVNALPGAPARLTMERLILDPATPGVERAAAGPELLYIIKGAVGICDDVNMCGEYSADGSNQHVVQKGSRYTILPTPGTEVEMIRLSLVPWYEGPVVATGTPIVDVSVATLPLAPACMFLLTMTLEDGASPVPHEHAGPVGFAEASGTVTFWRERSITGQLGPGGTAFVLPPYDPHYEVNRAGDGTPASVWMFGVVDLSQPLFILPTSTPDPSATAMSTPTVTPTGTLSPTATPVPLDCSVPTATPTDTPTPTPTP